MDPAVESLIHHVELNKAGWREQTLRLLVLSLFSETKLSLTSAQAASLILDRHEIVLDIRSVEKILSAHAREGAVIRQQDGTFRISESGRVRLLERSDSAEALDKRLKGKFEKLANDICPDADLTWEWIDASFLRPMTVALGARVYDFIRGAALPHEVARRAPMLEVDWPPGTRANVAKALELFVDPEDPDVRAYFLKLLNAELLVRASAVSAGDLRALNLSPSNRLYMKVFVDTNLLFSLMGLHENPADDSAKALARLIGKLGDRLDVEFVALPSTVDEARRTLAGYADRLGALSTAPNVVAAIENDGSELSGISMKYFREAGRAGATFTAREYFNPYLQNFLAVMRGFGIELHNADTDSLRTDQAVVDDILSQQEWEKKNRPDKAKSYEALEHDLILWHFVKRQRPQRVDSPLHARSWVGTIDFRLIAFDEYKQRGSEARVPLCIHPTTMLQMLQFWMPMTPELGKALVQSLWPMLPHVFDRNAEDVTLRILSALSRYENVADLTQETVTSVLVSDSLRSRIAGSKSSEGDSSIVEGEILRENERLRRKWEQEAERARSLESDIRKREEVASEEARNSLQRVQGMEDSVSRLTKELEEAKAESKILTDRLGEQEERSRVRVAWAKTLRISGIILVGDIGLCLLAVKKLQTLSTMLRVTDWLLAVLVFLLAIWVLIESGVGIAGRFGALEGTRGLGIAKSLRNWVRAGVGLVVVALLGEVVRRGFPG